jgi:hypothetical protein
MKGKTRCRLHGGASSGGGAPKGSQNALKHGIYGSILTEEEKAQWDGLTLGSVDDELRLCKLRLARALKAEQEIGDKPELDEVIVRSRRRKNDDGSATDVPVFGEKRSVRRDHSAVIDRLMSRIESLEKTRLALLGQGGGSDTPVPVAVNVSVVDGRKPESDA